MAGVKSTGLRYGSRTNILTPSLWRKFKKETGLEIEYRDFVTIIDLSNRRIKEHVLENQEGFKMPENLGYLVITRYKDNRKYIDHNMSRKLGKKVYLTHFLLNGGYNARVVWYTKNISRVQHIKEYKFVPDRDFNIKKSHKLKEGKIYNSFENYSFRVKEIKLKLDRILYGFNTD